MCVCGVRRTRDGMRDREDARTKAFSAGVCVCGSGCVWAREDVRLNVCM